MQIHQQHHGYLRGHQLLASSVKLERSDQEVVDRLSDIAGSIHGTSALPPYLTGYPLPSGEFFVFARTWPDPDAVRGGCVLTHSLLVPAKAWSQVQSPSALRDLHRRFPHADLSPVDALFTEPTVLQPLVPSPDEASPELVEALFLEERRPVLWIAENPEIAILRIVDALWPSLRSSFAFQTYSLKPRSVGDRLFDLMAAPRAARGRFADWPGRKVEGSRPARHPWTARLSKEIFETGETDLARVDPLGALHSDEQGDPSALRLSLLWNDLAQAERSPGAALGMLDILAASSLPQDRIAQLVGPIVEGAVAGEVWRDFSAGAGKFMTLLLEKLDGLPTPQSLDPILIRGAAEVLSTHLVDDLDTLMRWQASSPWSEKLVDRAIVEAVHRFQAIPVTRGLEKLAPERLLRIIDEEPALAIVALAIASNPRSFSKELVALFPSLSGASQDVLRTQIPSHLTEQSAEIVGVLASGIDNVALRELALKVIALPRRIRVAVWRELVKASSRPELRSQLVEAARTSPVDLDVKAELISQAFDATAAELDWLVALDDRGLAQEIARLHGWQPNRKAIKSLPSSVVGKLILLLMEAGRGEVALAILQDAPLSVNKMLDLLEPLQDRVPIDRAHQLLLDWLTECFPISTKNEALLAKRLLGFPATANVLEELSSSEFAELVLPSLRVDKRTARWTLEVLTSTPQVLPSMARAVDRIAGRLVRASDLDETGYALWARMIELSASTEPKSSAAAAWESFEFALNRPRQPVSELIKATFPLVYAQAKHDRRPVYTGFFSLPIDRPTKMRQTLADAYFSAGWPPRDLAIIAVRLKVADKIFAYVENRWGGGRYLREVFADLDPKRSRDEKIARKELRPFI